MKRYQNLLMLMAVVALVALPLWMVKKPAPGVDGKVVQIFAGADDKAKDLVVTIAPAYKPWFTPLMEPPSGEIGSLLFALQAALGAGFIGYWYGSSKTRAKWRQAGSLPHPHPDPPPEGEGIIREFLPLQGGGQEGDGGLYRDNRSKAAKC